MVEQDADPTEEAPKVVDLTLPMIPQMELVAGSTADALAEWLGYRREQIEEIRMALIEACINAFEHSRSLERRMYLNFEFRGEDLVIRVSDRGAGFSVEEAQERVAQKRMRGEQRRGWGLTIIHEMMDEVDIRTDEKGTVLTMVKRR